MAIETVEGDWLVRGRGRDLIRLHMTKDSLQMTVGQENTTQVVVCSIAEAEELRDWLTRKLNEEIE